MSVKFCPTEIMLANFLTKPLQGALFKKLRDVMLGYEDVDLLSKEQCPSQECVEESDEKEQKSRPGNCPVDKKELVGRLQQRSRVSAKTTSRPKPMYTEAVQNSRQVAWTPLLEQMAKACQRGVKP